MEWNLAIYHYMYIGSVQFRYQIMPTLLHMCITSKRVCNAQMQQQLLVNLACIVSWVIYLLNFGISKEGKHPVTNVTPPYAILPSKNLVFLENKMSRCNMCSKAYKKVSPEDKITFYTYRLFLQ